MSLFTTAATSICLSSTKNGRNFESSKYQRRGTRIRNSLRKGPSAGRRHDVVAPTKSDQGGKWHGSADTVPAKDDPIWTAARGFLVRRGEGTLRLVNGGREATRVKVTGEQTGGRLSLMAMDVAPGWGNIPHAHGGEDEAFYIAVGEFHFINGAGTVDTGPGTPSTFRAGPGTGSRIWAPKRAR
ncbi:hypothetical protein ACIBTV_07705 [Micromonospora sp. NPDC049366]|uniref:hypothetical protein n=1 Tax=Micromonospora sp. NPDC049366 TaxID=3364271 RepID=UPI0037A5C566